MVREQKFCLRVECVRFVRGVCDVCVYVIDGIAHTTSPSGGPSRTDWPVERTGGCRLRPACTRRDTSAKMHPAAATGVLKLAPEKFQSFTLSAKDGHYTKLMHF